MKNKILCSDDPSILDKSFEKNNSFDSDNELFEKYNSFDNIDELFDNYDNSKKIEADFRELIIYQIDN